MASPSGPGVCLHPPVHVKQRSRELFEFRLIIDIDKRRLIGFKWRRSCSVHVCKGSLLFHFTVSCLFNQANPKKY